jgi:hypothetical protein
MEDLLRKIPTDILTEINGTFVPTGSQVTCDPAPGDKSDYDFLVVLPQDEKVISDTVTFLSNSGFGWEGGDHYQQLIGTEFMSFRKAPPENPKLGLNLIVTSNQGFANRHALATFVCRRLNVMVKEHRRTIFQAILYDNPWPNEMPEAKIQQPEEKVF